MNAYLRKLPFEDDTLVESGARRAAGDVRHFFSRERVERAALQDERARIAHELHDGVLQAMTGIALQVEAVSRLLDTAPQVARERLRDVAEMVAIEQRELRAWIADLAPAAPESMASADDLAAALEALVRRIAWQWGIDCELVLGPQAPIPRRLGDQVYRIVQEGLNNAGRHARAQRVGVEFAMRGNVVEVVVADDGVGFPYRGTFALADLTARKIGPRSLKERIASLGGTLVLTSGLSGSKLEIGLPIPGTAMPREP